MSGTRWSFLFDLVLQVSQTQVPEGANERLDGCEPSGPNRVQVTRSVATRFHEARAIEHREVLRDCLLTHVDRVGDFAHGARTCAQELEDFHSPRFAERLEGECRGLGALHKRSLV